MPDHAVLESGNQVPRGLPPGGADDVQYVTLFCQFGTNVAIEQSVRGVSPVPLTTMNAGEFITIVSDTAGDWVHATGGVVWMLMGGDVADVLADGDGNFLQDGEGKYLVEL